MSSRSTGSRHRAKVSATAALPQNVKRALGAAGLTVILAGSLAYASIGGPLDLTSDAGQAPDAEEAAAADLDERSVWAQVSRGGSDRSLDVLEADPVTFNVTIDGEEVEISSGAETLADALIDYGIIVGADDVVSAEMNQQAKDGDQIEITRVGTIFGAETQDIPFDTEERETSSLLRGEREVHTEGVEGQRVRTYAATYEDGEEVSRTIQSEVLAQAPVNEVVLVGTAAPQPAQTPPSSSGSSSSSSEPPASAPPAAEEPPATNYSGSDSRGIARQMVADRGWGGEQFDCLDRLWQKESNWNHLAQNPSSGAYGIPQSLPGNKMASVGADWRTNPVTQMTWGLNYISGRYGTPCAAWGHSQAVNWY